MEKATARQTRGSGASDKARAKGDDLPLALLLGAAVGDALGVPVEFMPRGSFHVTEMQGFGTHRQPAGTWSDDTSLTLALADSLSAGGSRGLDLAQIGRKFIDWLDRGAYTAHGKVFDVGCATSAAIRRLKHGVRPEKAGGRDEYDNGNGSLMRISPLTFIMDGIPDAGDRFAVVRDVSSITHGHEWSTAACFLYVEMLNRLRRGMEKGEAYAGLREEFSRGVPFISPETLGRFGRILGEDIRLLPEKDIRSSGFVIHTLEASFWSFLTTDSYRDAVLRAVNLGDDTDTTGTVTGAMAGLAYGLDAIPREWRDGLAGYSLIQEIAAGMPRPDPLPSEE